MRRRARWPGAATALLVLALPSSAQVPPSSTRDEPRRARETALGRLSEITEQQRLLDEAEARLVVGDATRALQALERAMQLGQSPSAELALVRAYMQAGQYRRALGFAPHVAGEHVDTPAGTALYAWLLQVGGQGRFARVVLDDAQRRTPADLVLRQALAALSDAWPAPSGALLEGPWRAAPYAWGAPVPAVARVRGSGVLIDEGRAALVPTRALDGAVHIWIRNGLGQTATASIAERPDELPFTVVRLGQPLPPPPPFVRPAREPFGGSPSYALEYAVGAGDLATWPLLQAGFFGSVPREGPFRLLRMDLSPGPRGGPVFDAAGQLVGVAFSDSAGANRVVFAPQLRLSPSVTSTPDPSSSGVSPRMPVDEVYERGLKTAVQVIVVR